MSLNSNYTNLLCLASWCGGHPAAAGTARPEHLSTLLLLLLQDLCINVLLTLLIWIPGEAAAAAAARQ
jgi:hypothetical protein